MNTPLTDKLRSANELKLDIEALCDTMESHARLERSLRTLAELAQQRQNAGTGGPQAAHAHAQLAEALEALHKDGYLQPRKTAPHPMLVESLQTMKDLLQIQPGDDIVDLKTNMIAVRQLASVMLRQLPELWNH